MTDISQLPSIDDQLRALSKRSQDWNFVYWVSTDDPNQSELECETRCHDCAQKKIAELEATTPAPINPEGKPEYDYSLRNSGVCEEDSPAYCADCGEPLHYSATAYCAEQTLETLQEDLRGMTAESAPELAYQWLTALDALDSSEDERNLALANHARLTIAVHLNDVGASPAPTSIKPKHRL